MSLEQTWKELLVNIRPKVSEYNYNNWIKQLTYIDSSEHGIKLGAPNSFVKNWILDYYHDIISQELYFLTNKSYTVELKVTGEQPELPPTKQFRPPLPVTPTPTPIAAPTPEQKNEAVSNTKEKDKLATRLNPKYTFDRFVVGTSNQFVHAATMAAAELPGGHYNPLFIYGGVGLGKTHLLNAVGLKILEKFEDQRIIYLSAEQFMNELIFSIRFEKMDQFRKKFRDGCDVFLVDDVQFIIGKERTQEEFFHTFNTLYENQRQIVVTSDKLPKDLDGMEERLRSRFEWGLIADIQPPDLETRIAILKKKADHNGVTLTDEVALFLATQIKSNVRELEGSLIRLSAFASLGGSEISVELAKQVLKNIIKERAATCSVEAIQRTVADYYHIKVADIKSHRRLKSITTPRQIAMYLCKEHLKVSYPEIGQKFGGKDHSTVIHAVKKIALLIDTDALLKSDVEQLEKSLLE